MPKVIEAIFENGVIKPLQAVELEEHQRLRVVITPLPGVVAETRGMIAAPAELVEEVAEHDDFLPF
jgi:predicted DNA-binding antitoxin AbrB/MazE fold protein